MLKLTLVFLFAIGSSSNGAGLGKGPQPGEGEVHEEKKHNKRQFYLSSPPQHHFPFLPIYIPYQQVVEIHHVVMLQSPGCLPQQPGYQPQIPGFQPQQPGYQPRIPGYQPQIPGFQPQPGQQPRIPDTSYLPPTTQKPFVPPTMAPDGGLDDRAGPMMTNGTMPKRPSRCVWAIVACCSPDSTNIRYSCFELLGCPGAFWGVNPCEPKIVQAAANTALNFYMSGGSEDEGRVETNNSL